MYGSPMYDVVLARHGIANAATGSPSAAESRLKVKARARCGLPSWHEPLAALECGCQADRPSCIGAKNALSDPTQPRLLASRSTP